MLAKQDFPPKRYIILDASLQHVQILQFLIGLKFATSENVIKFSSLVCWHVFTYCSILQLSAYI